jgi:ABC-type phosphate/phosphonate transport system substrate-binding protein
MYPFDTLRSAWEHLYGAAAREVPGAPPGLRWDVDPHGAWLDPRLALAMSCGWPLVTALRDDVRTVGTFEFELDGAVSHLYRSVVVAREELSLSSLGEGTAAVNSEDSLSGHISLVAALGESVRPVVWTGAHVRSIEAVRSGLADVASIDALTWAYVGREDPASLEGLVVIGRGPAVPALPLIVPLAAGREAVELWRVAFARVAVDPSLKAVLDTLLIRGFAPLDTADYDAALVGLGPQVTTR